MNKFLMAISISFLLIGALGCSKESLDLDFSKEFSEKQIIHALEENFAKLHKGNKDSIEKDSIDGVVPSVYQMQDDPGYVYIYVFDTLAERKKAGSWNNFWGYDYESNKKRMYAANNVLITYQWTDDHPKHLKTASELGDIILKKLNPYEEMTFFGQSENWMGFYTIGYYQYFSNDNNDATVYDAWSFTEGRALNKRWEPGDEYQVSYKVSIGNLSTLNGDIPLSTRELRFAKSSGNVAFANIESIQIECNWEGQQEVLTLHKNDVKIRYEGSNEVPDQVKEMAYDHLRINMDYYNNLENEKVLDAKITGLTKINTGTASEFIDIQMWLLEYRILSESDTPLLLAGGMTLDDGWRTEYSSAGQPIIVGVRYHDFPVWQKIGITNTLTITEEYNDDYSEAAVSMYEKYSLHQ